MTAAVSPNHRFSSGLVQPTQFQKLPSTLSDTARSRRAQAIDAALRNCGASTQIFDHSSSTGSFACPEEASNARILFPQNSDLSDAESSHLPRPDSPLCVEDDEWRSDSAMNIESILGETCQSATTSSSAISSIPAGSFVNVGKRRLLAPSSTALAKAEQSMAIWEQDMKSHDMLLLNETDQRETATLQEETLSNILMPIDQPVDIILESSTSIADAPSEAPTTQRRDHAPSPHISASPTHMSRNIAPLADAVQRLRTPVRRNNFQISEQSVIGPIRTPKSNRFRTPFKQPLPTLASNKPSRDVSNCASTSSSEPRGVPKPPKDLQTINIKAPSLRESGLYPGKTTSLAMTQLGIDVDAMRAINPKTALGYKFLKQRSEWDIESAKAYFASRSLKVEDRWIENAWALILWKLSGLVLMDPTREGTKDLRWHPSEIMRQLISRYRREFDGPYHSPLQRILTRDASPSAPLVLCISDIFWDLKVPEQAEVSSLEVTDGWYRMRATIDSPLSRAVKRKVLRVGMKIACIGAKLTTDKKDPSDVFEGYHSAELTLSGNSTHLAKWDTKLGYQRHPFIAALRSLSADGGCVAHAHVSVLKIYPMAFLELHVTEEGEEVQQGPWGQQEESQAHESWVSRREDILHQLSNDLQKKLSQMEDLVYRLERQTTGPSKIPGEVVTQDLDDLLEVLGDVQETTRRLHMLPADRTAELANEAKSHLNTLRETADVEIGRDIEQACPPRRTRSFRILRVMDAETLTKSNGLTAQLTVWNASEVFGNESSPPLRVGAHYEITNLQPTSPTCWMARDEQDAEIFLSTNSRSRFMRTN